MESPSEILQKLAKRLKQEAEDIGLHLEQVAVIPNIEDPDGPMLMQAVFTIRPEAVEAPVTAEQLEVDKMFDDIVRGEQREQDDERKQSIVDDVRSWLEEK